MVWFSKGLMDDKLLCGRSHRQAIRPLPRPKSWRGGGSVSDRIANVIVLAEDQEHQNLVRRYLLCANLSYGNLRQLSSPAGRGSGSQYVREQFPNQVKECRGVLGRKTTCLLIVITDADNLTTAGREQTLQHSLTQVGLAAIIQNEPIVVLIPKWQVETWIKCLLGQTVSEGDDNTHRPPVTPDEIRRAARTIFDWSRQNAAVGATCVASLSAALPRWRRIG